MPRSLVPVEMLVSSVIGALCVPTKRLSNHDAFIICGADDSCREIFRNV